MTTSTQPTEPVHRPPVLQLGPPRPPLVRPTTGRVVGGVAAGLAVHLGVPVKFVRIGFLAACLPFGAGLAVYVFLWATMREGILDPAPSPVDPAQTAQPAGTAGTTGSAGSAAPTAAPGERAPTLRSVKTWLRSGNEAVVVALLGVLALAIAAALWMGSAGIGIEPQVLLPIVVIAVGAVFFWSQLDDADPIGTRRPIQWIWLVVGLGLTTLGLVGLLVGQTDMGQIWQVAGAVLAALVGVAVLAAPWILRLWSNLRQEQAARIRATERADIAAHLHDSVLQTLALIQRRAADPVVVARLARAQERQLRSYLYDEDARAGTLGAALTAALDEIEDLHGVPVELVVTGDRSMDEHLDALVKAVREAAWNAVRHGEPPVTAYVEVGPTAIEAFVRDHGAGFDLADVPDDRAGVRESIIGRMERHGGTATIRRRSGGTEIELCLPVETPASTEPTPPTPSQPEEEKA
ncbi:PspC domain-containing protein [Intrasporangium calvum]|uniref:PspC domain-containing protein n=1 Tax=Intrasporangium calvum TaxID=53358 RepID=A0ABT5GF75_9MICO|nr:ATP-binding protein [Intrasporangium calvum]MDC5696912.1 PspC domain-containing protein [Intrasporangium calvum]